MLQFNYRFKININIKTKYTKIRVFSVFSPDRYNLNAIKYIKFRSIRIFSIAPFFLIVIDFIKLSYNTVNKAVTRVHE